VEAAILAAGEDGFRPSVSASIIDSVSPFLPNDRRPMSHSSLSSVGTSFWNAGKALGYSALQLRSYLLPSHIRTYRKMVRQYGGPAAVNGSKCVFFDFSRGEIDSVSGRYLHGLVRDFEALGYLPCFRKNFCFLATMEHKRFKSFLLRRPLRVCESTDDLPNGSIAAVVTDRRDPAVRADRIIRVRYEAAWPQSDRGVAMTFFVHPAIYSQWLSLPAPDLEGRRRWRVFFAGRIRLRKYGGRRLPGRFGKMSRQQIMHALETSLPPERLRRVNDASDLEPGAAVYPGFVWSELKHFMIPRKEWLDVVKHAEFFLACPGTHMPLCHNLIESMARGVVPILEHPEFLDPPLQHDENCLVFQGREQLIKTFERVFQLGLDEIVRLRRNAYAYYQNYLAPGAFARRLLNSPHASLELFLNAYRAPRRPRS
jgi:hypothetical protein